jgi:subtilase family serine protease
VILCGVLTASGTIGAAVPGAAATPWPGGELPFGCANPAGHTASRLLPAAQGSVGTGLTCFGRVVLGVGSLAPNLTTGPVGYGPAQIQRAYGLRGTDAHGRLVAVVDAYNDPKAEADLAVYRRTFGLPPCTTANRCFRKVNEDGRAQPLPANDFGWSTEISLDLDAVSAACPTCHILLVEGAGPVPSALLAALDTAVRLGAVAVANSYGMREDEQVVTLDGHLRRPGVAIAFATGDRGYGVSWPAASRYVIAVGGTSLRPATNRRGWAEQAWAGAGSGCARYEAKPAWQHDGGCRRRTVGDVSADADPATGLGVYDTYNNCLLKLLCDGLIAAGTAKGLNGWAKIGGTSLSTPLVAAMYALAGSVRTMSYAYAHRAGFTDVTSGTNGSCGGSYLCVARKGYDGPTGLGTPRGVGSL